MVEEALVGFERAVAVYVALHDQGLVDAGAVGVADHQIAGGVELEEDVRAVVEFGRDRGPGGAAQALPNGAPARRAPTVAVSLTMRRPRPS